MTYITAEQVQHELRASTPFNAGTYPTLDTVNTWILEEAASVDRSAGMVFMDTQYTTDVNYKGSDTIFLKNAPIISVDSLTYATNDIGSDGHSSSFVEKEEDKDFVVDKKKGTIGPIFTNWSPKTGKKRMQVVYTAGYEEIPLVVQKIVTKKVALRVLKSLIQNNVNTGNDGGSISVGSISITEPEGISVNTIRRLQEDVSKLEDELLKDSTGVYRYEGY